LSDIQSKEKPGVVIEAGREGIYVSSVDGVLHIREVQLENKKRMIASDFINGYRGLSGKILGM
jgi:methionyl-tRNA formyltransferase